MQTKLRRMLAVCLTLAVLVAAIPVGTSLASSADVAASDITCPTTSGRAYLQGAMQQWDLDNPVRPAYNHADKNLALRSYSVTTATKGFVNYGAGDAIQPPQFATIFAPDRTPVFSNVYRVNNWNWAPSPNPGTRGTAITTYPVTALGLATTPGEVIQAPYHGYNIGDPVGTGGSFVIFADADSVTLKFTREDSAATGYTMHIDGLCTDPALLALYRSLDNTARNTYTSPRDWVMDYNLPAVRWGQVIGWARGSEVRVAIADTGSFQDPRSLNDWWQIRPAASTTIGTPSLLSPTNGSSTTNRTPTFKWNSATNAAKYQIQVANDSGFTSIARDQTTSYLSYTVATAFYPRTYYWRVRAQNSAGQWGAWSPVWSVIVK